MEYATIMQNGTGLLSEKCKKDYPGSEYKCGFA